MCVSLCACVINEELNLGGAKIRALRFLLLGAEIALSTGWLDFICTLSLTANVACSNSSAELFVCDPFVILPAV